MKVTYNNRQISVGINAKVTVHAITRKGKNWKSHLIDCYPYTWNEDAIRVCVDIEMKKKKMTLVEIKKAVPSVAFLMYSDECSFVPMQDREKISITFSELKFK